MDKKNTDLSSEILNNKEETGFWRGFKELYNDPDFQKARKDEFADGVSIPPDVSKMSSLSRRRFLALFAASAAFTAAACSDYRDKGAIIPYNKKPEEITPGIANFYASTCTACASACGILIKTREGRPIKVDGNSDHPVSKGKLCAKGQANILNLYDPDRLKGPVSVSSSGNVLALSWNDIDARIIAELKKAVSGGKEIAIISHTVLSPTQKKIFDDFALAFSTAKVYSYELFDDINFRSAFKKSFGSDSLPVVKLNEAKIILSLESDFLGTDINKVENTRLYAQGRDAINKKEFIRLYAVEGDVSLTGVNADYRIKLRADAIEEFILSLLNELIVEKKISSYSGNTSITNLLKNYSLKNFSKKYSLKDTVIETLVEDLKSNIGAVYATAGNHLPESTHIAVNLLNEVTGASKLYSTSYKQTVLPLSPKSDIDVLINRMQAGNVGVVLHLDTNPVYHFSKEYKYTEALKKVPTVVTLSEQLNETGLASNFVLPVNHNFESWGDYKTRSEFYSLQQPVISPIHNTRQKEAVLLYWINGTAEPFAENIYLNYLRASWEKNIFPNIGSKFDFKSFWNQSLHDGVVLHKDKASDFGNFRTESFTSISTLKAGNDFTVVLKESPFMGDGRFANNGWLQELPNPVTKVVWDNYAAISTATAKVLGVDYNDNIEITAGEKKITLPAFIQPGMADNVVAIELGYGRTNAGNIGSGVGFNANELIPKNPNLSNRLFINAKVSKTTGTYEIVTTQEHNPIDEKRYNDIHLKREIIKEGTVEEYKKNPKFLKDKPETKLFNIGKEHAYEGVKWAMSIDLNKCTGCNDCVAACNVENNIPVVGKDQVDRNREMMWIRIDRYYGGSTEEPRVSFQPMLCQHCDNAPCENVCPVSATNHSPDGLNQMAYNRCVGTRYCSNNCPYKVRRFNYYNFRDHLANGYYEQEPISLLYNPEVTVRSRGVMEKCTFCIQRIMEERQNATRDNREIAGENVKTACQEACPASAIVFGDMNNKESEINKYREHDLGYHVLEEINVRPNVTYIAKLRNIKAEKE